jgi:hypothetical protein
VSRLRAGEWVAAIGSVGLLVVLFLDWFGVAHGRRTGWSGYAPLALHTSGWTSLGWFMVTLLALLILGGLSMTYMTMRRISPALPLVTSGVTASAGALVFVILAVRVATQPGLGAGLSNAMVSVRLPAYLGLLLAAMIVAGAWHADRDERLHAPESAYTPPPARPVPGTR